MNAIELLRRLIEWEADDPEDPDDPADYDRLNAIMRDASALLAEYDAAPKAEAGVVFWREGVNADGDVWHVATGYHDDNTDDGTIRVPVPGRLWAPQRPIECELV